MTWSPNHNLSGRRKGFTLIELILVLVVLAVIVTTVTVSMRNFARGKEASNTAVQLVAIANYARSQAISDGRTYRLTFDPQANTYRLTAQDGGNFVDLGTEWGQTFKIPGDLKIAVQTQPLATAPVANSGSLSQFGSGSGAAGPEPERPGGGRRAACGLQGIGSNRPRLHQDHRQYEPRDRSRLRIGDGTVQGRPQG